MPRHLMGAAFAEGLALLADATRPDPASPASPERRAEIAGAIDEAFDLPPSLTTKDTVRTPPDPVQTDPPGHATA
ncbi:hypothetical protein ACWCQE_27700 [Streptomyces sp. NPDC002409]|uniref:hypothetical protein n=1 Tax=Streptomyces misionensis TaxID=67331 RepID=UPI00369ADC81